MINGICWKLAIVFTLFSLVGCGLYVPAKDELRSDTPTPIINAKSLEHSDQADYENDIVAHVSCELGQGLLRSQNFNLPWLNTWGTSVTITITAENQGGLNPTATLTDTLANGIKSFPVGGTVTSAQSLSLGVGVSAAATATRSETIQYTYLNSDLLALAKLSPNCSKYFVGTQIDSDLKIQQFIFDKAAIARYGNTSFYGTKSKGFQSNSFKHPQLPWSWPVYNSFTEELTFLTAYGGSVTPAVKRASFATNPTGSLLSAERTYTNDLIITMGPVKPPSDKSATALDNASQNQHNAKVQASAIATSIQSQTHN